MSSLHRTITGDVLVQHLGPDVMTIDQKLLAAHGRSARTLVKDGPLRLTIMGLTAGGTLPPHSTDNPLSIHVLDGDVTFLALDQEYPLATGDVLIFGAGVEHAARSKSGATFLLTVAFVPSSGDALREIVEQYHAAVNAFARGDPEAVKRMYSRRDDVTLANPWGPAVRGWSSVSQALDFASSRFRDGEVTPFERVAEYVAPELATILENERWSAKVSGRETLSTFDLRVTTTFRREDGEWKVVHRHADPITTPHPDGPLR
jgi:quercetin dioxygenase-like cupin family protein